MAKEYFKEHERYQLELLLTQKTPVKEIAKILNRSKTTIYREIKLGTVEMVDTNLKPYKKYCADRGQQVQDERSHNKGKDVKLGNDPEFVKFMEQMILEQKYSPVAILEHIKRTTLFSKQLYVLKQSITIYTLVCS
ncbi:helix-turn-helix domain-containing protein [Blautia wexlerae]|nr:helix-turn-helix domain-containing protein [Blautia wexlerae]